MIGKQSALPGFPRGLRDWIEQWLATHYPDEPKALDRKAVRDAMFQDLPLRFMPPHVKLLRRWWTKALHDVCAALGYSFPDGNKGEEIVKQLEFTLDEMRAFTVGKLLLAKGDIQSAYADWVSWVKEHPQHGIDADGEFAALRRVVGL